MYNTAFSLKNIVLSTVATSVALGTIFTIPQNVEAAAIRPVAFNTNVLSRNDDLSTGLVPVGFDLDFFGVNANELYVNNNGNVTFTGPLSTFTPFGLDNVATQIIAPFFADVDTRNLDSAEVTYGTGIIEGRNAFVVNWDDVGVGYFNTSADKLNKFQLVLIDRSDIGTGDFDIEFNYDQIQWETGDASSGTDGLGGFSASVGFSNGLLGSGNVSYEFPGSLVPGSFLDDGTSPLIDDSLNSNVLGRYIFAVRNGEVIVDPDPIPEPATIFGLLTVGGLLLSSKRKGTL